MTDEQAPEVRPFSTWLLEQAHGRTHDELSQALHDLVEQVRDTGKKGSLTLTLTVEPMKGDTDVLVVKDKVQAKPPEHDRSPSIFYPDADGNLSRSDPNQLSIDGLHEVPAPNHAN